MEKDLFQSLKNRYDIIGNDPALTRALEIACAVAPTDLTVLVSGESGVGKENIPRIIHNASPRKGGKYFAVNCGAIPEGTIDSELFGHEKGAYTGAAEMRKGYFEEADGGTLFLDEVGELPLASQAKLLRVLQDGEFIRMGSNKVLKTDVRVIAATNVDLGWAVRQGKFRADLFYRLNAVTIKMPALRERADDIPLLFRKFASDFSLKYGMTKVNLMPEAVALLKNYRWPGNIRQLKNVTETISALEGGRGIAGTDHIEIDAATLARYIPNDGETLPVVASSAVEAPGMSPSEKEALVRLIFQLKQEVECLREKVEKGTVGNVPAAALPSSRQIAPEEFKSGAAATEKDDAEWQDCESAADSREGRMVNLSIQRAGYELIRRALQVHGGNRKAAAAELGISERTLYRKIKEMEDETA